MSLFSAQIPTKKMVPLCRQLATAYDAGIPIIQSFETIATQSREYKVKRVMRAVSHRLRQGDTLGEAVRTQSKFVSPFFVHLLTVGEEGGRLDVMLQDLADFYEDRLKLQQQLRSAMVIPVLELIAAWYLGTFALGTLSLMSDAMAGTGSGVGGYFSSYFAFQIRAAVVFALIGAGAVALARAGLLGWITGAVSTHVWPLSTMTKKFGLSRFFRSLSLLVGSGLCITKCIENSAAVTANPYMERDLLKAVPHVKRGSTLVEAFSHTRYLTPVARDMLAVGEQSGNLELQAKKIAEYHLGEATAAADAATKVFGILIILAVGAVVGTIIITFYARLYGGMLNDLGV